MARTGTKNNHSTIAVSQEIRKQMREIADTQGRSLKWITEQALQQWAQQYGQNEPIQAAQPIR